MGNSQYFPQDGACLSYFVGTQPTDDKRIARINGAATMWWLRSPMTNGNQAAWAVGSTGGMETNRAVMSGMGVRPAIVISSATVIDGSTSTIVGAE